MAVGKRFVLLSACVGVVASQASAGAVDVVVPSGNATVGAVARLLAEARREAVNAQWLFPCASHAGRGHCAVGLRHSMCPGAPASGRTPWRSGGRAGQFQVLRTVAAAGPARRPVCLGATLASSRISAGRRDGGLGNADCDRRPFAEAGAGVHPVPWLRGCGVGRRWAVRATGVLGRSRGDPARPTAPRRAALSNLPKRGWRRATAADQPARLWPPAAVHPAPRGSPPWHSTVYERGRRLRRYRVRHPSSLPIESSACQQVLRDARLGFAAARPARRCNYGREALQAGGRGGIPHAAWPRRVAGQQRWAAVEQASYEGVNVAAWDISRGARSA